MAKKWIRLKKYCEESGEPDRTVRQKISDGHYRLGIHAKNDPVNKTLWINREAVDEWLEKANTVG